MRVLRVSGRTFTLLSFLYPRNRAEPYFSCLQNRADLFPVAATVRIRPNAYCVLGAGTKLLTRPNQKAQSPSCGRPVSCRVFQDVGHVHLPLVPWKSCISYFDTIGDDPVTLNRNRPSNGIEALPSAQSKNAVAISRHLTAQ